MMMRNTWSRCGMPEGVAPSPANAAPTNVRAQKSRVAAFFIFDFLFETRVSPPLTSLSRRGFRHSGFYRRPVTVTLKADQEVKRVRRMVDMNTAKAGVARIRARLQACRTDANFVSPSGARVFSRDPNSHVKQTQSRNSVFLEQPLVRILFLQLLDLRHRHLASIRSQLAVSLRARRYNLVVR